MFLFFFIITTIFVHRLTVKVLESENLQNENEKLKKLSNDAQNELKVFQKKMLLVFIYFYNYYLIYNLFLKTHDSH